MNLGIISTTVKANQQDAFELPTKDLKEIETEGGGIARCMRFIQRVYRIYEIDSEEALKDTLKAINKDLKLIKKELKSKEMTDEGCTLNHIIDAEEILRLTEDSNIWHGSLKSGEELVVEILKIEDGKVTKWEQIYSTGPRGVWQVSFGFSFIIKECQEEDLYYTYQREGDDFFIITKGKNRNNIKFVPSIFFTWMPQLFQNWCWSFGLSGGLGLDFANPQVFLGPTFSYNQNLKIHLGMAAHKNYVLRSEYYEGKWINENLTKDQLHEEAYRFNPFISLSLRFDQNPFK